MSNPVAGRTKGSRLRCLACDTIIQSKHRHDFVTCKCGALSVDGGGEYMRVVYQELGTWEVLPEEELHE